MQFDLTLRMQDLINNNLYLAIARDNKMFNSIVCFFCVIGVRSNRRRIESFIDYWIDSWLRKIIPRGRSFNDVDFRRQFICWVNTGRYLRLFTHSRYWVTKKRISSKTTKEKLIKQGNKLATCLLTVTLEKRKLFFIEQ